MKRARSAKTQVLEAAAAATMVFGAVALMITFFPIINPAQHKFYAYESDSLILRYVVGSLVTSLILGLAFWLNRRAKECRRPSHLDSVLDGREIGTNADGCKKIGEQDAAQNPGNR